MIEKLNANDLNRLSDFDGVSLEDGSNVLSFDVTLDEAVLA